MPPRPSLPRAARRAALLLTLAGGAPLAGAARPLGAQGPVRPAARDTTTRDTTTRDATARDATARDSAVERRRTIVLPALGYAPETGVQFGGSILHLREPGDAATRPSAVQAVALYTAQGQFRAGTDWDLWTRGNAWRVTAGAQWQRFPLPFWGIGDRTPDAAEERYVPRGPSAYATVQRRVRGPLYAQLGWSGQDLQVVETDSGGVLAAGTLTGSRRSRTGQLVGGVLWDSRDNVFAATRGTVLQLTASRAAPTFGSATTFTRLTLDARRYVALDARARALAAGAPRATRLGVPTGAYPRVLALQLAAEGTTGDAPFDQRSLAGSSSYLRGYLRGRYRDAHLVAAQVEYRAPWFFGLDPQFFTRERLGWVLFAGGGAVAPRVAAFRDARFLPSAGIGGRWLIFPSSGATVRIDLGFGARGQRGLYLNFNEAF